MTVGRRVGVGSGAAERAVLVRKHRPDYKIILYAGLLILIGIVVLFAISPYQIHRLNLAGGNVDQNHYMLKQLTYLLVGGGAFVAAAMIPIRFWQRYATKLLLAAIAACILLAILGSMNAPPAMCFNGACRWYDFGSISFQPAEFLKFALLLFVALFLSRRIAGKQVNSVSDTLVPTAILLGLAAIIVIGFQKDMGTGLTIIGMFGAMLFMAGLSYRLIGLSLVVGLLVGSVFVVASPHRLERIATYVNSSSSTDAANYHIEMAQLAIGSGGLTGKGLGNGVQAFGYLPEALNDSIFAVLGETFGFVGLVVILGIFSALLLRLISTGQRLTDPLLRMLTAGVFGWIATHVVINVGAMTGLLPLTGVTLPFLSFGGTSLLFIMMSLGLVYQASQYTSHQTDSTERNTHEAYRSRGRLGRSRHASTGSY